MKVDHQQLQIFVQSYIIYSSYNAISSLHNFGLRKKLPSSQIK